MYLKGEVLSLIHQEIAKSKILWIANTTLEFVTLFSLKVEFALTVILASDQISCRRPKEETRPEETRAMKVVWPPRKIAETQSDHLAGSLQTPLVMALPLILIILLCILIKKGIKAKTLSMWIKISLDGALLHQDLKMMTGEICAEVLAVNLTPTSLHNLTIVWIWTPYPSKNEDRVKSKSSSSSREKDRRPETLWTRWKICKIISSLITLIRR